MLALHTVLKKKPFTYSVNCNEYFTFPYHVNNLSKQRSHGDVLFIRTGRGYTHEKMKWCVRVCVFSYNIYLCWGTDWPPAAPQSYFPLLELQTELAVSAPLVGPPPSPLKPYG